MAKKASKTTKTKETSVFRKILGFFKGDKFRYTLGVFLLVFGVYLLVSFISFLFTGNADHSKLDISWKQLILNSEIKVENVAGKTGAFLGETIINRGFGLSSFIFVYLIIITAFRLFGRKIASLPKAYAYSFISIVWLSTTFGLVFASSGSDQFLYIGGLYGVILSNWLSAMVGIIGHCVSVIFNFVFNSCNCFQRVYSWLEKNIC